MTLYDSSVLIEYLDGDGSVVDYVRTHLDERAVAPPLVTRTSPGPRRGSTSGSP